MHMPEERSDSNSCAFLRKSADIGGDVGFCLLAACLLLFLSFFELDEIGEFSMRSLLSTGMLIGASSDVNKQ